jgi:hypothetical protein
MMDWKDLEKMTVVKIREEALKHPEIKGVHGKGKPELMDELSAILGIEKPHTSFGKDVVLTKGELRHKIRELKEERERLLEKHDHKKLHDVRRRIHDFKVQIRRIERQAVPKA